MEWKKRSCHASLLFCWENDVGRRSDDIYTKTDMNQTVSAFVVWEGENMERRLDSQDSVGLVNPDTEVKLKFRRPLGFQVGWGPCFQFHTAYAQLTVSWPLTLFLLRFQLEVFSNQSKHLKGVYVSFSCSELKKPRPRFWTFWWEVLLRVLARPSWLIRVTWHKLWPITAEGWSLDTFDPRCNHAGRSYNFIIPAVQPFWFATVLAG